MVKAEEPGGWGWLYSRCNLKLANWATCPSPTVDKSFSTSSSHTRDVRVGAVGRYKYTKTWCASFGFIIITSQKRATIDMCHVRGGWATSSRPLLEHLLRIPPIAADIESHSYIEIWETYAIKTRTCYCCRHVKGVCNYNMPRHVAVRKRQRQYQ